MNLSDTIHWATKMINSFECLDSEEKRERKFPNKMNSVTKQIFILPLLTQLQRKTKVDENAFKIYLEKVQLKDLDTWQNEHLSENRTVKRRKILSLDKAAR